MVRESSKSLIVSVLADGKPRSHRDIVRETGLSDAAVWCALGRCWKAGLILRSRKPLYESERIFKGRAGVSRTTRPYYLYILKPEGRDSIKLEGYEFVSYSKEYLDARGRGGRSKAQAIWDFIEKNRDKAWFSKEIAEALKDHGVEIADVMSNVRRFERKGLVYVRGYRSEDRQTPFKEGFLITFIDPEKQREKALEEAIERTNRALEDRSSTNPVIQRVHIIRDLVIEASKLKELLAFDFIQNKLKCPENEANSAIARAMQLYPSIKEVKLFNAYRYYYHESMNEEDLKAAIAMKENYIRKMKGRANRIGHNWEAVVEWFVDSFTTGAHFQTQEHRTQGIDARRITLRLLRGVGGRRNVAEVDRVWTITPGLFTPPVTYVLSCKWGVIRKEDVDDFFNVLKWSKEFGVDTPEGRQVKQGVVGVFAGGAFNPNENVQLKDGSTISLSSYAARMNIQLLKATDFNEKLHQKGCPAQVTVQRICKIAKDEREIRGILDAIWENPGKSEEILSKVAEKNEELYKFEKMLEETKTT
jgi:DNA-binding MarR family transcriptional regulator